MSSIRERSLLGALLFCACAPERTGATVRGPAASLVVEAPATESIAIGKAFTIDSQALGEARRINVFVPTIYGAKIDAPRSVLYMLDGGTDEDFLHVAGSHRP